MQAFQRNAAFLRKQYCHCGGNLLMRIWNPGGLIISTLEGEGAGELEAYHFEVRGPRTRIGVGEASGISLVVPRSEKQKFQCLMSGAKGWCSQLTKRKALTIPLPSHSVWAFSEPGWWLPKARKVWASDIIVARYLEPQKGGRFILVCHFRGAIGPSFGSVALVMEIVVSMWQDGDAQFMADRRGWGGKKGGEFEEEDGRRREGEREGKKEEEEKSIRRRYG